MPTHAGPMPFTVLLAWSCGGDVLVTQKDAPAGGAPAFSLEAAISPAAGVVTGTVLTCAAAAADTDGAALTPRYDWTVAALPVATGDTYTVRAADTDVGDRVDCTATAVGADGEAITSAASVSVENTPPQLHDVAIAPGTLVFNDSRITCTASVTDPDEDGLAATFSWLVSGSDVGTGAVLDLDTTAAQPLDPVVCQAQVDDSHGGSDSVGVVVVLDNRAPTEPTVAIAPASPTVAVDDLVCSASGSTDADGQAITTTYAWSSSLGAAETGDTVPSSATVPGEAWTCTATASDGMAAVSASARVVVAESDCGDPLVDVDGHSYPTVEIGTQCWMASNLKATHDASGAAISRWCCDCSLYGGMYDWSTVMNGSTADGAQGICPDGWHVPSDADWFTLETHIEPTLTDPGYIGWNETTIGDALSSAGPYGFDWQTGGFGTGGSSCNYDYDRVLYWTSTDHSSDEAVSRLFNTGFSGSNRDLRLKGFGFYVRCIQD
ncbi:MAG: FISUMP domain-containing protein [Myxococcota bacterium]|nr:FISUMP domain-containing protein [Myxococcota bacterium]